jgi:hypothetical protein
LVHLFINSNLRLFWQEQFHLDIWNHGSEVELLLSNLREEPFHSTNCVIVFKNLFAKDKTPINNLQHMIIVFGKPKLIQHLKLSKAQLMDYILKIEENCRLYFYKNNWFRSWNFIPEELSNINENAVGFDEFVFIVKKKDHSLERRDLVSFEAVVRE